jgi:hypothetical protein
VTFAQTPLIDASGPTLPSGYDHIGDITWADGFVFAAITGHDPEGTTPPAIAVFRGDASLTYVDHVALSEQRVSFWVGVDPEQGFLYSSDRMEGTHVDAPFTKYQIDWDLLQSGGELRIVDGPWTVSLLDEALTSISLVDMQGGAFSEDGTLLYISNGLHDTGDGFGIHAFEVRLAGSDASCGSAPGDCVAMRVAKSTNGSGPFNYEYHPGWSLYQEPEGLTYWDLDALPLDLPGETDHGLALGGQLHAIMLDNDYFGDEVYLKHYRVQAPCEPGLGPVVSVVPSAMNFGEVGVGGIKRDTLLVSNTGDEVLAIESITLGGDDAAAFAIPAVPIVPTDLAPGSGLRFEIELAPSAAGLLRAQVLIGSSDPNRPAVAVPLLGIALSFAQQIDKLIDAFDAGVLRGDLVGTGPGASAPHRLEALRNMLEEAVELVQQELISEACTTLADTLARCDGDSSPPDFVAGGTASAFNDEVRQVWTNLGCSGGPR